MREGSLTEYATRAVFKDSQLNARRTDPVDCCSLPTFINLSFTMRFMKGSLVEVDLALRSLTAAWRHSATDKSSRVVEGITLRFSCAYDMKTSQTKPNQAYYQSIHLDGATYRA